jgi:hypothetical protein
MDFEQVQRNGLFGQDGMFSIRQDGRLPQERSLQKWNSVG